MESTATWHPLMKFASTEFWFGAVVGVAATVIGGVIAGIIGALFDEWSVARRVRLRLRRVSTTIFLDLDADLYKLKDSYSLLYVRGGRDHPSIKPGPPRLDTFDFEEAEDLEHQYRLHATFKHTSAAGAQFKCFVEAADPVLTKAGLISAGYQAITYSDNKQDHPTRLWFIHPNFGLTVDRGGFLNNYINRPHK